MKIFFTTALFFCLAALYCPPATLAKSYNVDIRCDQLSNVPSEVSGMLFYWLPGWWSALKNDPYVNEIRIHLLVEDISAQCRRNPKTRILQAARNFATMPPAPDHGLQAQCKDFANAPPPWQFIHLYWLQGYFAYKNGTTQLNTDYQSIFENYLQQCRKNSTLRMEDMVHTPAK